MCSQVFFFKNLFLYFGQHFVTAIYNTADNVICVVLLAYNPQINAICMRRICKADGVLLARFKFHVRSFSNFGGYEFQPAHTHDPTFHIQSLHSPICQSAAKYKKTFNFSDCQARRWHANLFDASPIIRHRKFTHDNCMLL